MRRKDDPRGLRARGTDGHIQANWFRSTIWYPAVKSVDPIGRVRIHDLRHVHASWLLAGGADLQVVKQCLGHGSQRITGKYLHTLPDTDETALDALSGTRNRASSRPDLGCEKSYVLLIFGRLGCHLKT